MHWKLRALILAAFDRLPGGERAYQLLQGRAGRFRDPAFLELRLRKQRELAEVFVEHGGRLEGARIVEVGTGWVPLLPLGFWLCGAAGVVTFDLHRYLHLPLTRRALRWMARREEALAEIWSGLVPAAELRERWAVLARLRDDPEALLEHAGIEYRAPADAARSGLEAASADLHLSTNVLEHVPGPAIVEILREAGRLLAPGGLAVHHADPSDHFSHFDPGISRIHFLRYEEAEWRRWGGNRYSYVNRLHDGDYRRLFGEAGLRLRECRSYLDEEVLRLLEAGFPLAAPFRKKSREELARGRLTYVAEVA